MPDKSSPAPHVRILEAPCQDCGMEAYQLPDRPPFNGIHDGFERLVLTKTEVLVFTQLATCLFCGGSPMVRMEPVHA